MYSTYKGPPHPLCIPARYGSKIRDMVHIGRRLMAGDFDYGKFFLNNLFRGSHFIPGACISSLYGCGAWEIGSSSLIGGSLVCESRHAVISIGNKTFIGSGTQIIAAQSIHIGNNVLIAGQVIIQDHDSHSLDAEKRKFDVEYALARHVGKPVSNKSWDDVARKDIRIEDNSWIGTRAIILKGVTVGENSIVAAGSVVTKNVPPNVIAAGNPARIVKETGKIVK